MDCIEGMKLLDNNSIDCIITSPPYNVGFRKDNVKYLEYQDNLSETEYLLFIEKIFLSLKRILKPTGTILFNFNYCQRTNDLPYKVCLKAIECGLILKETICWEKFNTTPLTSQKQLTRKWEFIWLFVKSEEYVVYKKPIKNYNSDSQVFYEPIYNIIKTSAEFDYQYSKIDKTKFHNATFPQELVNKLLNIFTKENDLVLDCFSGGGTTLVCSKKLKRNYLGFEICKDYCDFTEKKLNSIPEKLEKWF
jgi:DNA modification methylase